MDDLKQFRQIDSLTPGHPEAGHTDGVEVTTGPLGQGFANGVGLGIAQAHLAATFNKAGFDLVDNYTYGMRSGLGAHYCVSRNLQSSLGMAA